MGWRTRQKILAQRRAKKAAEKARYYDERSERIRAEDRRKREKALYEQQTKRLREASGAALRDLQAQERRQKTGKTEPTRQSRLSGSINAIRQDTTRKTIIRPGKKTKTETYRTPGTKPSYAGIQASRLKGSISPGLLTRTAFTDEYTRKQQLSKQALKKPPSWAVKLATQEFNKDPKIKSITIEGWKFTPTKKTTGTLTKTNIPPPSTPERALLETRKLEQKSQKIKDTYLRELSQAGIGVAQWGLGLTLLGKKVIKQPYPKTIEQGVQAVDRIITNYFTGNHSEFYDWGKSLRLQTGLTVGRTLPDIILALEGGNIARAFKNAKMKGKAKIAGVDIVKAEGGKIKISPSKTQPSTSIKIAGGTSSVSETLSKQASRFGKKVDAVSASTGFKKPFIKDYTIYKPDAKGLERGFFADPAGRLRTTRLGGGQKSRVPLVENLVNLATEGISVADTSGRAEALLFQDTLIENPPKQLKGIVEKLKKNRMLSSAETKRFYDYLMKPTGRFKGVGYVVGTESETLLSPLEKIRITQLRNIADLDKKLVSIYEAEVISPLTRPKTPFRTKRSVRKPRILKKTKVASVIKPNPQKLVKNLVSSRKKISPDKLYVPKTSLPLYLKQRLSKYYDAVKTYNNSVRVLKQYKTSKSPNIKKYYDRAYSALKYIKSYNRKYPGLIRRAYGGSTPRQPPSGAYKRIPPGSSYKSLGGSYFKYGTGISRIIKRVPSKTKRKKTEKTPEKRKERIKKVIKQEFIYTSDLYSRFYDIKATKKQKKRLVKPGRVFTGLEIRKKV